MGKRIDRYVRLASLAACSHRGGGRVTGELPAVRANYLAGWQAGGRKKQTSEGWGERDGSA